MRKQIIFRADTLEVAHICYHRNLDTEAVFEAWVSIVGGTYQEFGYYVEVA